MCYRLQINDSTMTTSFRYQFTSNLRTHTHAHTNPEGSDWRVELNYHHRIRGRSDKKSIITRLPYSKKHLILRKSVLHRYFRIYNLRFRYKTTACLQEYVHKLLTLPLCSKEVQIVEKRIMALLPVKITLVLILVATEVLPKHLSSKVISYFYVTVFTLCNSEMI
jgi:hypothetical protein